MKLIPYHKTFANYVMEWQLDHDQRAFFRGIDHYMTLDECAEFNGRFTDLFIAVENDKVVGMASAKRICPNVYDLGVLIVKDMQKKGRGTWLAKLMEDYLFNIRGARSIIIYVGKDHGLQRVCEDDLGYSFAGHLRDLTFVNGKLEDVIIYQKLRR